MSTCTHEPAMTATCTQCSASTPQRPWSLSPLDGEFQFQDTAAPRGPRPPCRPGPQPPPSARPGSASAAAAPPPPPNSALSSATSGVALDPWSKTNCRDARTFAPSHDTARPWASPCSGLAKLRSARTGHDGAMAPGPSHPTPPCWSYASSTAAAPLAAPPPPEPCAAANGDGGCCCCCCLGCCCCCCGSCCGALGPAST